MLGFSIIFYLVLYLYFDEVVPNEYGIKKSPFFCFKPEFIKDTCNDTIECLTGIFRFNGRKRRNSDNFLS